MSCLLCRPEPAESLTGPQMQQSGVSVEQSEYPFVIGIYQKKVMHPVSGAAARRSVNHGSLAADVLFCNWENNLSFALAFFVFSAHFAFLLGQIAFSGSCKYLAEIMPESLTKILYPFSGGDSRIIHPEGDPATPDSVRCHYSGVRKAERYRSRGKIMVFLTPCGIMEAQGTGFRFSLYFTGIYAASGASRHLIKEDGSPKTLPWADFLGESNDF